MDDQPINQLSSGQRANKYIESLFQNQTIKTLLIDQPEDQLDAKSVTESIIEPIWLRYSALITKGIQIILVSHNSKIIINTGTTNLIKTYVENNNYKIENVVLSEFIKTEDNINLVDGKKMYVHKRGDLYGRNKNSI